MKIGFLGTGIMGGPMAGHLADNGHDIYVDGSHRVPDSLRERVYLCNSAKEVAEQTELIILMVPDTPDVEDVLFAETGVAAGLSSGKVVADMSSISPVQTKEFAKKIK